MKFLSALLLFSMIPLSVSAQEQRSLPSRRGPSFNARAAEGTFDLVTYVDDDAIIYINDKGIRYLVVSGSPVQDAGSNYSQEIPHAVFGTFNMDKVAGRGTVTLVEEPNSRNQYTATVRIKDDKAGRDLYHVRLNWTWNPSNPSRPPTGGGSERIESRNSDPGRYDRDREGEFQFRGKVDGVTVLHIHSDQVRSEIINGQPLRNQKFQFSQPLPTSALRNIELVEFNGRGRVELVEKPWEGNRFTAVVRITDNNPGSGDYSFRLTWRR